MMATLRRFVKAQGAVLRWLELGGSPRGFYVPYRHASAAAPLGEDEPIAWLERRFDELAPSFAALLAEASRYNGRLREFERERPGAPPGTPRFDQDWFPGLDAALAYALVRLRRPRRIVEVGSGHSTRFLAAAIHDEGLDCALHSIDPRPRREIDALCSSVSRAPLSRAELPHIAALEAGDVLFVDSSHVALPGTDVDFLVAEAFPLLRPGVLVHVHDVFLPYGYPAAWRRRCYNEQNAVLALLSGGERFKPLMASAYMRRRHPAAAARLLSPCLPTAREASLWLEVR